MGHLSKKNQPSSPVVVLDSICYLYDSKPTDIVRGQYDWMAEKILDLWSLLNFSKDVSPSSPVCLDVCPSVPVWSRRLVLGQLFPLRRSEGSGHLLSDSCRQFWRELLIIVIVIIVIVIVIVIIVIVISLGRWVWCCGYDMSGTPSAKRNESESRLLVH